MAPHTTRYCCGQPFDGQDSLERLKHRPNQEGHRFIHRKDTEGNMTHSSYPGLPTVRTRTIIRAEGRLSNPDSKLESKRPAWTASGIQDTRSASGPRQLPGRQ